MTEVMFVAPAPGPNVEAVLAEFAITDDISVRNIFGYMQAKRTYSLEADGSPFPVSEFAQPDGEVFKFGQFSEELQLRGKSLGGSLEWIAGGHFFCPAPISSESNGGRAKILPIWLRPEHRFSAI